MPKNPVKNESGMKIAENNVRVAIILFIFVDWLFM
jgi:hypothetical protein